MVKLHVFGGFRNEKLGITESTELGHLYSTVSPIELDSAAKTLGLNPKWRQTGGLIHYDVWGRRLIRAKKLYKVVNHVEFAKDMEGLNTVEKEVRNDRV